MQIIIRRSADSTHSGNYHKRDVFGKCWTGWVDSFDQVLRYECKQECVREYTNVGTYIDDKLKNGQQIVCVLSDDRQYTVDEYKDLYPEYFI